MRALSIIGIIVSVLGILLSLVISELYSGKNDKVFMELFSLHQAYLEIVRETLPPVLMSFFTFFLVLSIAVNRKF
jgi:uncharacterized BrkB/YihY/UPF0761 family membrane protein